MEFIIELFLQLFSLIFPCTKKGKELEEESRKRNKERYPHYDDVFKN